MVLGPDLPLMGLDDGSYDGEAEADALFLRREERVEELGQAVGWVGSDSRRGAEGSVGGGARPPAAPNL
jgi:hypothetical protein